LKITKTVYVWLASFETLSPYCSFYQPCHFSQAIILPSGFRPSQPSKRMSANITSVTSLTRQEAEDYLKKIRSNKGVDDPEGLHYDNVQDLNKSLDL
jgi:hypothetical protein